MAYISTISFLETQEIFRKKKLVKFKEQNVPNCILKFVVIYLLRKKKKTNKNFIKPVYIFIVWDVLICDHTKWEIHWSFLMYNKYYVLFYNNHTLCFRVVCIVYFSYFFHLNQKSIHFDIFLLLNWKNFYVRSEDKL